MRSMGGRLAATLGLTLGLLMGLVAGLRTEAAPERPVGRHCGDVGPLPFDDPSFCGCTWGEVLVHGQPVPGAAITLTYGGRSVTGATRLTDLEPHPTFDLTGHDLGAERGDVMTLTVRLAGQSIIRPFRAWPDDDGEQHITLALEERGVWAPWVSGGYTRALALSDDTVWAGGPDGVLSASLSGGVTVAHTMPWTEGSVRALAVDGEGHVWAAGDGGVAAFDGLNWQAHTPPLTPPLRALAVDPTDGTVWLGSSDGGVAAYDGAWRDEGSVDAPVTALAVDAASRVWAGTWGNGVYRQDGGGGWDRHRSVDGLASDNVLAAAAERGPRGSAVWFGTAPYISGQGPRGGVARYDLGMGVWRTYTTAHGLPADATFPEAPAAVHAVALDEAGRPWIGTTDGVYTLAGGAWWAGYTAAHGLRAGPVRALAPGQGTAVAATHAGLDRLDPEATPGEPPVAQIDAVHPPTVTAGTTLTLSGGGLDGDEGGERIVAWDWRSDRDGPLCTTAACALPHDLLTPGEHTVALRVQDDEGVWSTPKKERLIIERIWEIHMPILLHQP